jgi:hypothetical protein
MRQNAILGVVSIAIGLTTFGCGEMADPSGQEGDISPQPLVENAKPTVDADGYVLTPMGRYHQSCVHGVPAGAEVTQGQVRKKTGEVLERFSPCAYVPRETPSTAKARTSGAPVPTINGWIESVDATAITSTAGVQYFDGLTAQWTVPATPTTVSGQTVFFFPSFTPSSGNAIIQPVLQFGSSAAGGGNYWTFASWYIDHSNNVFHSYLYSTVAGHTMLGTMQGGTCTSGVCYWVIKTADQSTSGAPTVSQLSTWTSEVFAWVQAEVLEAYGITSCAQLPNVSSLTFSSVYVSEPGSWLGYYYAQDVTGSLTWGHTFTGSGLTPSCGYAQSGVTSNSATLAF